MSFTAKLGVFLAVTLRNVTAKSVVTGSKHFPTKPETHASALPRPMLVVCAVALVILFAIDIVKALRVLPMPDGDTIFFYPIYLSVANTGELSNPLISPIAVGGGPLTWHGWLQPMLLGYCTKLFGGGMTAALLSEAILKQVGLAAYFAGVLRSGRIEDPVAILGSIVVYVSLSASQGRPELLASVLLLAWWFLDIRNEGLRLSPHLAVVFLGLLGATQPTVATIASGLFLVALLLNRPLFEALKLWIAANAGATLVVLAMLAVFYPFGVLQWIDGLARQAAIVRMRNDDTGFLRYWMANRARPLQGLLVIVAALGLGWATLSRSLWSAAAFAYASTMALVWYLSARIPALEYNATVFAPVVVGLGATHLPLQRPRWRLAFGLGAAVLAASSTSAILVSCASMLDTRDAASVHGHLQALADDAKLAIELPPALLVGAVPFPEWKRYRLSLGDSTCPPDRAVLLVRRQANSGLYAPAAIQGCELIANRFSDPIHLHSWRLPLVLQSYGYAVYRRAP